MELVTRNLRAAIEESGAEIQCDDLPVVLGDDSQLVQVFQNLLSNAIKFRGDETPQVQITARRRDKHWVFAVQDNGIGIDPEEADNLFKIFRRLHPELPGTGIGLTLCKRIIERHGGKIWVNSAPGHGSVFRFTLPAVTGSRGAPDDRPRSSGARAR